MITKDDMKKLLNLTTEYLKKFELSEEEILVTIKLIKNDAVRNGIYNENSVEGEK